MINSVHTSIPQADGSDRYVIIEPINEEEGLQGMRSTSVFEIYTDVWDDEQEPEYLGKFIFENGQLQCFEGQVLSLAEQAYLAVFIEYYEEPDIYLEH